MLDDKQPGWTVTERAEGKLLAMRWEELHARQWKAAVTPSLGDGFDA